VVAIPMFILGQGHTPLLLVTVEQAIATAQIILCDEARRTGSAVRGTHPKSLIEGSFVSYSGKCSWRRRSDRVERIYAAVELLKHSGLTDKQATSEIAELLGTRVGNSKRGRPARGRVLRDLVWRAQIIRSLCNSFKRHHPWKEGLPEHDPVVEKWFMYALQFAAWSHAISGTYPDSLRQPRFEAALTIAATISACAEKLRALYAGYPLSLRSLP
jgi:hypothetical protein